MKDERDRWRKSSLHPPRDLRPPATVAVTLESLAEIVQLIHTKLERLEARLEAQLDDATTKFGTSHAKHILQVMISNVEKVSIPQPTTTPIVLQFVQRARRQEHLDAKSKSLQLPPSNKLRSCLLHYPSSSDHHPSTMRSLFSILLLVLKSTRLRLHLQTQQATLMQCLVQTHENGKD